VLLRLLSKARNLPSGDQVPTLSWLESVMTSLVSPVAGLSMKISRLPFRSELYETQKSPESAGREVPVGGTGGEVGVMVAVNIGVEDGDALVTVSVTFCDGITSPANLPCVH
jgi:hypothetical protein